MGTETVGFRDIVGGARKSLAFEPFPANLDALRTLSPLNNWNNVRIFAVAIADKDGALCFSLPPDNNSSGVGHLLTPSQKAAGTSVEVNVLRLDSLAQQIGPALRYRRSRDHGGSWCSLLHSVLQTRVITQTAGKSRVKCSRTVCLPPLTAVRGV